MKNFSNAQMISIIREFEKSTGQVIFDDYFEEEDFESDIKLFSGGGGSLRKSLVHASGCTFDSCCTKTASTYYSIVAFFVGVKVPRKYTWITNKMAKLSGAYDNL